ncbi:uncharacterized protein H6S33_005663 [Morchella sextelata]|uniref:uncharacterized protein n=1 Tax=Morchella sextelata TaxID=1174677 RepID=UPI001D04263A|nr:uncharacterized protein H6S33_005663 [Morchella sextelata]KAH0613777.1 hypothetical protein H6S33_005663 [Morchella sextelata]
MNARVALRWAGRPSLGPIATSIPTLLTFQRHKSSGWFGFGGSKDERKAPAAAPESEISIADAQLQRGDLAGNTLFDQEEMTEGGFPVLPVVNPLIIDPERHKWTWPKRADAREHRRRGRLSKKEQIMQTEKELLAKSHMFKTSLKKLGPIARQIAGKSLDHAITQMKFSPKKAARDVLGHLKQAKNEAILHRRMDPGQTYIEQAWVGRGPFEFASSHRAKGRIDRLRLPYTSLTVVLKEEKTRIRIMKEKEEKYMRKKPWVQLPSRAIYGQTQYYRW